MFVYLAHPIDLGRVDDLTVVASDTILSAGLAVFDPASAWSVPAKPTPTTARAVNEADLRAVKFSAGVVAVVSPDLMSFGVPLELRYAARRKRPTVVFTSDAERMSGSLILAALGVPIVQTPDQLTAYLTKWSREAALASSRPPQVHHVI